jgi:hypothetical protein
MQTLTSNRMGNYIFKSEMKQTHSTIFSQPKRILSVHRSEPETPSELRSTGPRLQGSGGSRIPTESAWKSQKTVHSCPRLEVNTVFTYSRE